MVEKLGYLIVISPILLIMLIGFLVLILVATVIDAYDWLTT